MKESWESEKETDVEIETKGTKQEQERSIKEDPFSFPIFCGNCVENCPTNCLSITEEYELSTYDRNCMEWSHIEYEPGRTSAIILGHDSSNSK